MSATSFDYKLFLDPSQLYEQEILGADDDTYISLVWEDMYSTTEIGFPELPVKYLRFLVPTYCNNISVSLKSANLYESRRCHYPIYPVQEPILTKDMPLPEFASFDIEAYNSIASIPDLRVVEENFIDGFNHVVTVEVKPVVYKFQENIIDVYGDLTLTVSYNECSEEDMVEKPIFPKRYTPFFSLDDNILDPTGIKDMNDKRYSMTRASASGQPEYYYVIVPKYLKAAMSDFVTWKTQKGYNVVVKTIEDILAMSKYKVNPNSTVWDNQLVDEAASLRAFLRNEYEDKGFFYCLLVGNSKTSMPIRKSISNGKETGWDTAEGYVPTDIYFTDLKYNWNLSKKSGSSIYSASNPSSFSPQICTGRLLCSNEQEIQNWFYKVKLYEANPGFGDNSYLSDALFFEEWSWKYPKEEGHTGYANHLIGDSKDIRNFLDGTYFNCELVEDPARKESDRRVGISGKDLINKISQVGLSSWHGHGSPVGVACSWGTHYITSEDSVFNLIASMHKICADEIGNGIDNMSNQIKPAIVYSISCDNTPFDCLEYENYPWECRYNLGEAFTVAGKFGGPVFLGNTREGYINSSAKMELLFFKGLVNNRKIGYAENYSKINYSHDHIRATHSIIGDAEIDMWIGKPLNNNTTISQKSSAVSFSGSDLSGARINLYDGQGNYASATATSNTFSYSLNNTSSGFDKNIYAVSVWKPGYLPIIKLFGQNASIINQTKTFIVKDALFGSTVMDSKDSGNFIVGRDASLTVKAIDNITVKEGFIVDNGGKVNFECDRDIMFQGCKLKSGSNLYAKATNITLQEGFNIEKGSTFTIIPQ